MIELQLNASGTLSHRHLLRRRSLNRYHTLRRCWRRWRGGGIPMTYSPPPFIGYTCPPLGAPSPPAPLLGAVSPLDGPGGPAVAPGPAAASPQRRGPATRLRRRGRDGASSSIQGIRPTRFPTAGPPRLPAELPESSWA